MKKLTTILGALLVTAFAHPAPVTQTITYDSHRFFTYYLYESLPEEGVDNLVVPKIDGEVQEVRVNWKFRVDTEFEAEAVLQVPGCEVSASRLVTVNSQDFAVRLTNDGLFYNFGTVDNDLTWQSDRLGTYDGVLDFDGPSGDSHFVSKTTEGTIAITNPRMLDAFEGDGWAVFAMSSGLSGTTFIELPASECVQILADANRHTIILEASIEIDYIQ